MATIVANRQGIPPVILQGKNVSDYDAYPGGRTLLAEEILLESYFLKMLQTFTNTAQFLFQ